MDKRTIDKIRLTTQMNEMVHIIKTTPYKSSKAQAKQGLDQLQEQYKSVFGEYSADHVIHEEASQLAVTTVSELISDLKELQDKYGNDCPIELKGTLMCKKDGNFIILSTDNKQM